MIFKNVIIFTLVAMLPAGVDFIPLEVIFIHLLVIILTVFIGINKLFILLLTALNLFFIHKYYGFVLSPESSSAFLSSVILFKLCYKREDFNKNILYSFLYVISFCLFTTNLYTILTSSLIIINSLYCLNKKPEKKYVISFNKAINFKSLFQTLLLASFVIIVFLVFPRFNNFFPSANTELKGDIGYAQEINNTQISNLNQSYQKSFIVKMSKQASNKNLYWRGRTMSYTDGYNWKSRQLAPEKKEDQRLETINYQVSLLQDLKKDIPLLDSPISAKSKFGMTNLNYDNTYRTYRRLKKITYSAKSSIIARPRYNRLKNKKQYLQVPSFIPKGIKDITKKIDSNSVVKDIGNYLLNNNFQYTLNPGSMPTMASFLKNKAGFCTHYASLSALIMRLKGIPARIVSGFQGGEYNDLAQTYIIYSNDAHAWVEYFNDGRWKRFDPVEFVAIDRINKGAQAFFNNEISTDDKIKNGHFVLKSYYKTLQFFQYLDFKISSWVDQYDRSKQKEIIEKLKVSSKIVILIITGLLTLITIAFYFVISYRKKHYNYSERLFTKFLKKMENKKIIISKSMTEKEIINMLHSDEAILFIKQFFTNQYSIVKDEIRLKELFKKIDWNNP